MTICASLAAPSAPIATNRSFPTAPARIAAATRAAKSSRLRKNNDAGNRHSMVTIAVDAMGGDDAPKAEVEGAIRAARSLGVRVILVGKQDVVRAGARASTKGSRHLPIEIQHASERGHHGGQRRQGGPPEARQLHPRRRPAGARRRGRRRSSRPATPAPSWPPPNSCRACSPAWIVRRWPPPSPRSKARRWSSSTWAPTSIARRACWRSSPSWATFIRA